MPATSRKQQHWAAGCLHNPQHMKGKCPSPKVAREFSYGKGLK